MLPAAERATVTSAWNDTAAEYPRATLPELFEAAVRRAPDAVAIVGADGGAVRYAEAFEICEYGARPDQAMIRKLFPFLPTGLRD